MRLVTKKKCCSIICRLNKINFVSFVSYSLLVSCFQGIHFTETIHLCEGRTLLAVRCIWESSKIGNSRYLKVLLEGKSRLYMAMSGFMVFLWSINAYIHPLWPESVYLHILLESHLLATSQTTNALAKIIAVALCIKLNSHSVYFDPNYTAGQNELTTIYIQPFSTTSL